ncbi:MAG: polysaccharide deacetylase family protein [Sporichthyaceae bacterium]
MRRPRLVLAAALTGMLLTACSDSGDSAVEAINAGASTTPEAVPASPTPTAEPTEASVAVDPASVSANELGQVPVMMYHVVKPDPKGEYDQSPEEFKAELQRLYDEDYRPVTAQDFVSGNIDIPAGMHPVVLTFDDSTVSQAQIGPDGKPTADTALGILEAFGEANPDFKPTATFYVNNGSFSDAKVIPWLVENGYEVGSHTATHANLKQISDAGVQKEIATNVAEVQAAVDGYTVTTFARPFGIGPVNAVLAYKGTDGTTSYDFSGVMLVGSNPSKSPFAADFNPFGIPRVRSGLGDQELDSKYWLDVLEKNPKSRYTSDGDPEMISYPSTSTVQIGDDWKAKAQSYDPSGSSTESSTGSASATPAPTSASTAAAVEPSASATP